MTSEFGVLAVSKFEETTYEFQFLKALSRSKVYFQKICNLSELLQFHIAQKFYQLCNALIVTFTH